jgi:DNA-binding response OmpR family regulator
MFKKILFVEDDRSLAVLYRRAFTRLGYHVDLAAEGMKALELIDKAPPDLIVVDVKLAGDLNGLEVLSRVLVNHRIPSIINTAYACFQDSFRSWSADAYIIKSSDLTELQQVVSRLLSLGESSGARGLTPEPMPAGSPA